MFNFRIPGHIQLARNQLDEARRHALEYRAKHEDFLAQAQDYMQRADLCNERVCRLQEYLKVHDVSDRPPPRPIQGLEEAIRRHGGSVVGVHSTDVVSAPAT